MTAPRGKRDEVPTRQWDDQPIGALPNGNLNVVEEDDLPFADEDASEEDQ